MRKYAATKHGSTSTNMNESLAIVLAGIGGAVVSGVVGIPSSAISLRAARRQLENQTQERERDRRYQVLLAILQRRHQAMESIDVAILREMVL